MRNIFLLVLGVQVSKQVDSSFPFSYFQILSSLLGCYFSGIFCIYHLWQMFIRFLTITFDFYRSLVLKFSCITVRLSDGMFLFSLVSDQFHQLVLQCFIYTSQFLFWIAQCVRRLWLLRTSFFGKTALGVRWLV